MSTFTLCLVCVEKLAHSENSKTSRSTAVFRLLISLLSYFPSRAKAQNPSNRDLRDAPPPPIQDEVSGCRVFTPHTQEGFWSGCALRWCAHRVHTVQTVLCTPSPSPFLSPPQLPTSPPPVLPRTLLLLLSQGQLLVLKWPLEAVFFFPGYSFALRLTLILSQPAWSTAAASADSSSWCSSASWWPLYTQVKPTFWESLICFVSVSCLWDGRQVCDLSSVCCK